MEHKRYEKIQHTIWQHDSCVLRAQYKGEMHWLPTRTRSSRLLRSPLDRVYRNFLEKKCWSDRSDLWLFWLWTRQPTQVSKDRPWYPWCFLQGLRQQLRIICIDRLPWKLRLVHHLTIRTRVWAQLGGKNWSWNAKNFAKLHHGIWTFCDRAHQHTGNKTLEIPMIELSIGKSEEGIK